MEIIENSNIKFDVNSSLEQWRVDSLLTKEPETIAWIEHYAKGGGFFFDIGANIGVYSLYAAKVNKDLQVFSFEPVRSNFQSLLKNATINEFDNINVFNLALSNSNTLSSMHIRDLRVGNSGAQLNTPIDETGQSFKSQKIEKIVSFSIDFLVDTLNFPVPTFIKIDVDGHEKNIVSGLQSIIKNDNLKSILIEFNSKDEQYNLTKIIEQHSFIMDKRFNDCPNHSGVRRDKNKSVARNVVFSRK